LKIKKKKSNGRTKDEECRIFYILSTYVISLKLDPKVGDRRMGKRKRQKTASATFIPRVRSGTCDFNYAEQQ
jgi:thymidylate kinase